VLLGAATGGPASREARAQGIPGKPRVPPGRDPGGIAVAIVGAGVDYARAVIAARLARDGEGEIVAWDVLDNDARPLERPARGAAQPPAHAGTAMAELLLAEAPGARLIPVRVPDGHAGALGSAMGFIADTPARVAVVLAGAEQGASWLLFRGILARTPHLLVVLPAARSVGAATKAPSPAFETVVSVTAVRTGASAQELPRAAQLADLAVGVPEELTVGGGGEAVSRAENHAAVRLAALVARLATALPAAGARELKARVLALARPTPIGDGPARLGIIDDPQGVPQAR
jgi:hypothetical protein